MQVHGLWEVLRSAGGGHRLLFIVAVLWALVVFVVHLVLAMLVARDAQQLKNARPDISPPLWFFVVMISSLLGVVAYWLMNHSTLSRRQD